MLARPLWSMFPKSLVNMLAKCIEYIEYTDPVTGHYIGQLDSLHIGQVTGELASRAAGEHIDQVTGRLEQSDFFSQWMGGKMKIRLGKPAVNISKLAGGKNGKARREALREKLRADLYLVYRKHWLEIKITEYVICRHEAF